MPHQGPIPSDIVVIGDYPDNDSHGFRAAGKLLSQAGLTSTSCFFSTLTETQPPLAKGIPDLDNWISERKTCPGSGWVFREGIWFHPDLAAGCTRLEERLEELAPKLVIGLGKAALAWFCGHTAIAKWRGSRLTPPHYPFTFLPTIHPRSLSRQPDQEFILKLDLQRAYNIYTHKQIPRAYSFKIKPLFPEVIDRLSNLLLRANAASPGNPLKLSGDLETRAGNIACFGIAWSETDAICIPHLVVDPENPFYWPLEEEALIVHFYSQLFYHPNVLWVGQNYSYDCQYFWRHWGILPLRVRDTMIGAHSLHSNIRKGLDFLSSMYAHDHIYWKDEIKEWDPKIGESQYWTYNCKDACITYEIDDQIQIDINERNTPHSAFQQSLFFPVLRMMNRGIRIDKDLRGRYDPLTEIGSGMKGELIQALDQRQSKLEWLVGHEINPRSSTQLLKLFYNDLGIPGIQALGSESLTTNSPALVQIAQREPLLAPLCQLITELRSISVFLNTFIEAALDTDGRMRCSFSIAGPTTYRFSSSENAFGSGMNLQNIPQKTQEKIKSSDYVKLPNIRKLFIPDEGYEFFDIDLDRADLQVVVWEADDTDLKKALRLGLDMHCFSACDIFDIKGIPLDELFETHPNYPEHCARIGEANRAKAKIGVHATDYGVGDRKLAVALGITVHEAARFRAKWFAAHPGIRKWHVRTERMVAEQGYIENPFGARLYNFGRLNLPEFLGWLPQSTVAGVINRALVRIDNAEQAGESSIQLLIQVHDSLAGQFLTSRRDEEIARLRALAEITIPYPDPLIIPIGVKTSTVSWGVCQ